MRIFVLITALGLSGCAHARQEPLAYAFATGPSQSVPRLVNAIATCRAIASVVNDGERALVLMEQEPSAAAFNCLSLWVHQHPESGVAKVGFVGQEQAEQP